MWLSSALWMEASLSQIGHFEGRCGEYNDHRLMSIESSSMVFGGSKYQQIGIVCEVLQELCCKTRSVV